jgi:hypothetical protein
VASSGPGKGLAVTNERVAAARTAHGQCSRGAGVELSSAGEAAAGVRLVAASAPLFHRDVSGPCSSLTVPTMAMAGFGVAFSGSLYVGSSLTYETSSH